MNEGAAMLGLVGSVGHRNTAFGSIKNKSFTSQLQVDCKEGKFLNLHVILLQIV